MFQKLGFFPLFGVFIGGAANLQAIVSNNGIPDDTKELIGPFIENFLPIPQFQQLSPFEKGLAFAGTELALGLLCMLVYLLGGRSLAFGTITSFFVFDLFQHVTWKSAPVIVNLVGGLLALSALAFLESLFVSGKSKTKKE